MLQMCQALGFRVQDDPHEHGVKLVKLDLMAVPTPARLQSDAGRHMPTTAKRPAVRGPFSVGGG